MSALKCFPGLILTLLGCMNKKYWLLIALLWVIFGILGYFRLDPDFGLHIRPGQDVIDKGIGKTDRYSYTMPTFPEVRHEWLTNVGMAFLYPRIGMLGMAAVFSLLTVLVFVVSIPSSLRKWATVPILLGSAVLFNRAGVRPQVEDWLFLAVLIRWVTSETVWKKWKWLMPLMFILWANLHGGFVLGLVVLLGMVIARLDFASLWVWIVCLGAVHVNPYGVRIWEEVWLTMSDPMLKKAIMEWLPFFMTVEFGLVMLVAMLLAFGWRYRSKLQLWKIGLLGVTFAAALSSLRHGALFVVVSVPVLAEVIGYFNEEFEGQKEKGVRINWFNKMVLGMVFLVWGWGVLMLGVEVYNSVAIGGYPVGAVKYLVENGVRGRLFADYGWGGYLMWKLPDQKLFVDGRMPSWRYLESAKCKGLSAKGESCNAFAEYLEIVDKGKTDILDKYGVETVMLKVAEKTKPPKVLLDMLEKIHVKMKNSTEKDEGLESKLKGLGWREVYKDKVAVIYEK